MTWSSWLNRTAPSLATDIIKLLAYSMNARSCLGTRTTNELIWEGANMDWFLKWGTGPWRRWSS